ncbi:MAG: hypothetical protein ACFFB2_13245 [Promethearchaeota archaeon]
MRKPMYKRKNALIKVSILKDGKKNMEKEERRKKEIFYGFTEKHEDCREIGLHMHL